MPTQDLLERATRRFLIDAFLGALDWDVADAGQIVEEARARTASDERLYFDYLGLNPQTRAPVLLVEAKGLDVVLPRKPYGPELNSRDMSALIAEAVDAIKRGDKSIPVISEWAEFLRDMHSYITSLDELGRATLKRAIISAGGWLIVIREPLAVFDSDSAANIEHISCYTSVEEILVRHEEIYKLLHRSWLIDTLPLTLKVSEALEMIPGEKLGECFRAVLVATSASSGGRRQHYPTRSVYPSLLVRTGDRWFAIVDYDGPIEEPRQADRIDTFLTALDSRGTELERRLATRYGRTFEPLPIESFPGFLPKQSDRVSSLSTIDPVVGSTADRSHGSSTDRRVCVTHSGEMGAPAEFIVITGTARFYKYERQEGPECPFHLWKNARQASAAAATAHIGYVTDSFTEDGQDRHCAHNDLISLRANRCHVRALETHLCCQACLFAADCWTFPDDRTRLPCPPEAVGIHVAK